MPSADDEIDNFGLDAFSETFLDELGRAEKAFPSSFCAPPPSSRYPATQDSDSDSEDEFDCMPLTQEMHDALDEMEYSFVSASQPSDDTSSSAVYSDAEEERETDEGLKSKMDICVKQEPLSPASCRVLGGKRKRSCGKEDSDSDSDFSEDDMEIYTPPESKPLIALSSSPTLVSSSSAGSPSPPPPAAPAPTHLSQFFSAYPAFKFDPVAPASQQFDALKCKYHREWDTDDKKQAETGYARAMSFTFTELYGKDADILENWHKLCHAVRIHPPPDTIEECRTAMYDAHVNLIDLADAARTGQQVRRFPSEEALSVYSRATNKILKLHLATPSPLLRALLRKIFNPRSNNDRRPRKRPRWEVEDSESE